MALRIAVTNAELPTENKGGVSFQVHYLSNALVERGHDVTVFTFSPPPEGSRYKVHQFPSDPRWYPFRPFVMGWLLGRTDFGGFDVVHTHGDNFMLRGPQPQVRTFHGSALDEMMNARNLRYRALLAVISVLEKIGTRTADECVGVSQATLRRFPSVPTVIPCGVDLVRFQPGGEKSANPSILFVGTSGGRKRGSMLAEVFVRDVRSQVPDAELWMVSDTEVQGPGVLNFGKVPLETLVRLYREAWVFCLPSTYEGFGVPYIEAMACGTPVVASPNPGAREVLADGEYGLLVADADMGPALASLLTDRARRAEMGGRGIARARDYDWPSVVAQYEAAYARAIDRRAQRQPR